MTNNTNIHSSNPETIIDPDTKYYRNMPTISATWIVTRKHKLWTKTFNSLRNFSNWKQIHTQSSSKRHHIISVYKINKVDYEPVSDINKWSTLIKLQKQITIQNNFHIYNLALAKQNNLIKPTHYRDRRYNNCQIQILSSHERHFDRLNRKEYNTSR